MTAQHLHAEAHFTANPLLKSMILALAALSGIVAGLAWSVSPIAQSAIGANSAYPVRIALPEAQSAAPSIDVLRTDQVSTARAEAVTVTPAVVREAAGIQRDSGGGLEGMPDTPEPLRTGPGGMLAVDYDLAEFATANRTSTASDGSVQTDMPLLVNGVARGSAQIRIADSAQILIATSSLASAIGDQSSRLPSRMKTALDSGTGFLPFYELRAAGIDVQYDPVNDRIALTLPS